MFAEFGKIKRSLPVVLFLTEEIRKKETLRDFSRLLGFSRVIRALQYANFFNTLPNPRAGKMK